MNATVSLTKFAIALLSWTLFGALLTTAGAHFVLNYGQTLNAIGFGAALGAAIGLVVSLIAASPVVSSGQPAAFRRAILGSMLGALMAAALLLGIGGFPRGTQADLTLVALGPASLAIGAVVGSFAAVLRRQIGPR